MRAKNKIICLGLSHSSHLCGVCSSFQWLRGRRIADCRGGLNTEHNVGSCDFTSCCSVSTASVACCRVSPAWEPWTGWPSALLPSPHSSDVDTKQTCESGRRVKREEPLEMSHILTLVFGLSWLVTSLLLPWNKNSQDVCVSGGRGGEWGKRSASLSIHLSVRVQCCILLAVHDGAFQFLVVQEGLKVNMETSKHSQ